MNLLEFLRMLPQDYYLVLDYYFESLKTQDEEIDEEYSYEGIISDYESSMNGYSFQFDFTLHDFKEVHIDVLKKKVYMKYLTYCD